MTQICSFCKREVKNNVCCDYCGTPVIFSDFDIEDEKNDIIESNSEINNETLQSEQDTVASADEDDVKINIYNKAASNENSLNDDATKVINIADIKNALAGIKAKEELINSIDETIEKAEGEADDNEEFNNENEESEIQDIQNTNIQEQNIQVMDNSEQNAENSILYNINCQNTALQKEPYKGDTKLIKFLKNALGIMFLIGLVSLFFPALSPTELTDSLSFSIIDIVLLVATFIGMCLSFFEKNGIRKFIYGIIFSIVFLAANVVITKPFPPKNTKELIVIIYLLFMFVMSLSAHMIDKHSKYEKAQIWFDSFNYVAFFINLFAIALSIMIYLVLPDDIVKEIMMYLIALIVICIVSVIGIFLMFKRKIAGANLYMLSSIFIIVFSMIAYHNIMNTIGYYNSVISLMNVIGGYYSKFIALLVIFPIVMFVFLSSLNKKEEK